MSSPPTESLTSSMSSSPTVCVICGGMECDVIWVTNCAHSKCLDSLFKPEDDLVILQHDEDITNPPFLR